MKSIKQLISLLLVLSLLCAVAITVHAHEVPDENQKGTITVEMKYDGKAVTGGTLTAYRVGQIRESDGNYSFEKTDAMAAFASIYEDISSAELAEKLAVFVGENKISAYAAAENRSGKAVFTDLELGLYLILQTKTSEGYEPLKPFLVSVPMNEDGHYIYEVNAEGKFQLQQKPEPTEPTKPADSTLPQTGQLNWPIPVLVVLGLAMFSVGWALRCRKKNDSNEK